MDRHPERTTALVTFGEAVLHFALKEIGRGEEGSNNMGPDVDRYRFGRKKGAWCAWFLSYSMVQAAERLAVPVPIKPTGGAKRFYRRVGNHGAFADIPKVGDIACWDRGKRGSWMGHVGIVSRVEGTQFWTVEGNRGVYPSKVRIYNHEVGEGRLIGFAAFGPIAPPHPLA